MSRDRVPLKGGLFLCAALGAISLVACLRTNAAVSEDFDFFEKRIRPVLVERCYQCHSAESEKLKGDLRLDTRAGMLKGGDGGPAIVPGKSAESKLIKLISGLEPGKTMHPESDRLTADQIASLKKWIDQGASWPEQPQIANRKSQIANADHWAFQPLRSSFPPKIKNTHWPQSPIDHFILAKLEEKRIVPTMPADKRTLIRRATFDLIGLPPTPDEIEDFLHDDSRNAFAKVVDRLLASPHYGERWGRHWLDVVRYADTAGETADFPVRQAWRYRNWVIDVFNQDKPYDQFVREQIAGDILARQNPSDHYAERITATGYLAISRRFGFDSENYHHLTMEDTIDTLGKSILGLSIGCARCHDHKYDPIFTRDYYGLYGIFESTRYAFPGSEQKQRVRALMPLQPPEQARRAKDAYDQKLAELERELELLKSDWTKLTLVSLDDLDGDFELQAKAAGGSRGVLVPPWVYTGAPSVTAQAQSPYRNLYQRGGSGGVALPNDAASHSLGQALQPALTSGHLHFNIDFHLTTNSPGGTGSYRFYLGQGPATNAAVEVFLSGDNFCVRNGNATESIRPLQMGSWYNLQLDLNLREKSFAGTVGVPGDLTAFSGKAFAPAWNGKLDYLLLDGNGHLSGIRPALELDNVGVRTGAIPSLAATLEGNSSTRSEQDPEALKAKIKSLVGPGENAAQGAERIHELKTELAQLEERRAQLKQRHLELLRQGPFEMAYAVTEGTPRNAKLQKRGDPQNPGDEVPRQFLQVLAGQQLAADSSGSGRLELAEWLVSQANPLTARVMVNRIWQYHFNRGLVATPNDFGKRGQPPSHPELLDYLALLFCSPVNVQLTARNSQPGLGWSIKQLHRFIMLSSVYQIASDDVSQNAAVDPNNELLWKFNRRRLEAETIRDTILAVSGELDKTPGGPHPFPSEEKWGYTQHAPFNAVYDSDRRSVYLMTQRIKRHPFLALFDGADPNASTPERRISTVPTQALFFLNDPFVHAKARSFAARLLALCPDQAQQIDLAFQFMFGRPAGPAEHREAGQFFADYLPALADLPASPARATAWAAYARVLFGSNEFLFVD